jgi:hypothetical protein
MEDPKGDLAQVQVQADRQEPPAQLSDLERLEVYSVVETDWLQHYLAY